MNMIFCELVTRSTPEYRRRYYQENRDRIRARHHKNYMNRRQEIIAKSQIRYRNHKERYQAYSHKSYLKYKDTINENSKRRIETARLLLIELLGGKCVQCGVIENLEADHIFGGGNAEKRYMFNSYFSYIKYYLNHPQEAKQRLQVLCEVHNIEKKKRLGEIGDDYKNKWDEYYKELSLKMNGRAK